MTRGTHATTVPLSAGTVRSLGRLTGAGLETLLGLERAYVNQADKLAISARLREARERAGFEQHELAEMLTPPVTDRTIRNYEGGHPPFRYLRQWAEITEVPYEWLLRGEESPASSNAAPAPSTEVILRRLEAQDARMAHMEKMIEDLLGLLGGGPGGPEEAPRARVVFRPERHARKPGRP